MHEFIGVSNDCTICKKLRRVKTNLRAREIVTASVRAKARDEQE